MELSSTVSQTPKSKDSEGALEKPLSDQSLRDDASSTTSVTAASDSDSASASQEVEKTSDEERDHNSSNIHPQSDSDTDDVILLLPTPSPEQEKINTDYCALESMRKANLEMDFGGHKGVAKLMGYRAFSQESLTKFHECCVACLYEQRDKQRRVPPKATKTTTSSYSFFWQMYVTPSSLAWQKKAPTSCLVCNAPICHKHCCPYYRKIDGIAICGHCAPLFTQDFVVDLLKNGSATGTEQKRKLDFMLDCYDRAKLLLRYSSQFMEDVAVALETSKKSNDTIGLGSSSMGILSGVTGVGAVAASAIHVGAIATVLSPVGPPLLIASLLFGGAGAAASTSTEAIHHYSEPNQVANKILALHELVHCLLAVTDVIHQAMHLREAQCAIDNNYHSDDDCGEHDLIMKELLQSKFDAHGRIFRRSSSSLSSGMDVETSSSTKQDLDNHDAIVEQRESENTMDKSDFVNDDDLPMNVNGNRNGKNNNKDSSESYVTDYADVEAEAPKDCLDVVPEEASSSKDEDNSSSSGETADNENKEARVPINVEKTALAKAMPLAPLLDDVLNAVCKGFMAPNGVRTAATSAMKVAQVATVACGALSAAMIFIEGRNMRNSLKSLQAGSPCLKAQMLRRAKKEIDLLPDTHEIAAECELYLQAKPLLEKVDVEKYILQSQ